MAASLDVIFQALAFAVFLLGSAALAWIDAHTMRLPNRVLYPVAWIGIGLLACATATSDSWSRLAGALLSAALLVAVFFVLHKVSGLGLGDVRLAGLLGVFLGWVGPSVVITGLLSGMVGGGAFGAVLLATGKAERRMMLPYGPFLILGAWIALLRVAL
jgi:leader peptidase (prepilin peptidase) / N-methyltransferase